jgi:hypothetical protein
MLSSAPFIAELPQDLAGKTASLVTVHGRYGNNATTRSSGLHRA